MSRTRISPRVRIVAAAAAITLAGGILAVGTGAAIAAPTGPDNEKRGECGSNAFYEADLERDDGRLETSFEIDGAAPGEEWRIVMSHNGEQILDEVRTVDNEREIDVERDLTDASGVDTVEMSAAKVGGGGDCSVTLTR